MMYKASGKVYFADAWPTNYRLGMWAWVLQKITGIELILYGLVHFWGISTALVGINGVGFDWFSKVGGTSVMATAVDLITVSSLIYHTMNGLGIILMDLGIGVRNRRPVFWGLMAIAFIVWFVAVYALVGFFAKHAV